MLYQAASVSEAELDSQDSVVVNGNPVWHSSQGDVVGHAIVKVLVATSTDVQPHEAVMNSVQAIPSLACSVLLQRPAVFSVTYYR